MKIRIDTEGTTLESTRNKSFQLRMKKELTREMESMVHVHHGIRCDTERRGYKTPHNRSPLEIVVDASEGFIPLWEKGTILRWRFQERSVNRFEDPEGLKDTIVRLMGDALLAWGDAAPVKFVHDDENYDFEYVIKIADDCQWGGCVLASAFFPSTSQAELEIYPKMFTQSWEEQVDTLIHEFGHVFGLRHFFALISETTWPAEVFGVHEKFSIMNYGADSKLTEYDRSDLKRLYEQAWNGELNNINGTPIRFMRAYSAKLCPPVN